MKTCDLHSHSTFSDGSLTPTELIALAKRSGLSALALTDHNTTKGLAEFLDAGKENGVQAVAGCEFSTENEGKELHILGLFLPEKSWVEVEDFLEFQRMAKHNSNVKLIENLAAGGYEISYEEVAAITDAEEFNRNHVARVLFKKGYVKSVDEAFKTLLKKGGGYYEPAKKHSSLSTIRFIKANGGVAVWAHPFLSLKNKEEIKVFLPKAVEAGLDGMEVLYSTYTPEQTEKAKNLADKFGLLYSGGSDFHGEGKPDISLGTGYGNLKIPYEFYQKLKQV